MKFDIKQLTETVSTNDDAKRAAENDAAQGTVFWALRQQAGRGRQGRVWASPEGNLYCSVIMRPKTGMAGYGFYSFVAALALADAAHSVLPNATIELKWPNDVLVGGKKISGILLEAGEGWLVIGMGMNVLHYPSDALYPVTSLAAETPNVPGLEDFLDRVLAALARWSDLLDSEGFVPVRMAWLARARKGSMRVRLHDTEINGAFSDLDEQGRLCLILADQSEYKINTGDVFF